MKGAMWLGFLLNVYGAMLGLWGAMAVHDEPLDVQCGMENMQVVIPRQKIKDGSMLKVLNEHGKMDILQTDASCNLWVTQKPDGSVIVATAYEGCYVTQTDGDFVLTLGFSKRQNGGKRVMLRKKMKCSAESYNDAPSPDQCAAISKPDRLSCASSQDACASVNCCYDPSDRSTPCYFGNKVTAYCTPDGFFSVAVPSTLTVPRLDLNSVRLLGSGTECDPVARTDAFLLYTIPLSSCGTKVKVAGDQAFYENELLATRTLHTWNRISITRDTNFRLLIRCSFAVTGFLPLKVNVVTLPPPPLVSSEGLMRFEMRIAVESQYNSYYEDPDYPVIKVLRDPVYAEVLILEKSDPNLILVLHQCWATPTTDPLEETQWPILVSGCPFNGDNYISELIPIARSAAVVFPTHYSRFSLKTFAFVDENTSQSLGGQVYLHCSASACTRSPPDTCITTCSRRKRSNVLSDESETVLVSSEIPLYFETFLQNAENDIKVYEVGRLSQPQDQLNIAMVTLGLLGVLLLSISVWVFNKRRKSGSLLISKPPSEKDNAIHIQTISGALLS